MRAHKFSLVWLGHGIETLSELRRQYIGSERVSGDSWMTLAPKARAAVTRLGQKDLTKSKVLHKYLNEMTAVVGEMRRVLKPGKAAVVVVGPSMMRGVEVLTHYYLAEIAESLGFRVAGIQERSINRDRRMLPTSFGRNGDSMIEQRMYKEFVIGLIKE